MQDITQGERIKNDQELTCFSFFPVPGCIFFWLVPTYYFSPAMRILRIQFENLNSLRSGDVDLEHGAIAEAGIFAITGPTGAGKSTLLDALTLALYGRAARYDKEPNPENMMSRHTGSCRAEVLFEVPGGRYQARWELRRARGKADGKLQAAKRTIIEDGCGTVLAEKIDEADRLIAELTGLDYERFRRSVLLAQGEFTRFLKAKPDERAELLESLTGTAIYSNLSELAYREATRREEELEVRREALGRIVLLTEEERAARQSESERLTVEIDALAQQRAAVVRRIEAGRQLVARLGEEAEIARKQAALLDESAKFAPKLDRLQQHRLAQPFLASLQTLDALESQSATEAARVEEAGALASQANGRLAAGLHAANAVAGAFYKKAQIAVDQCEAELHALGEQLVQAEAAEGAAATQAAQAATALAELLKGRTVEEIAIEFKKLEQRQNVLGEVRAAMEKRDNAAAEAARLADEEAHLIEQVEGAAQEKTASLAEAEAQAAVLESARADLEIQERIAGLDDQRTHLVEGQACPLCGALEHPYLQTPPSVPIEEARRNLNAAKTANDTAAREARVAADVLTRIEERLDGVRKRRGEIRRQQTVDHEAFEKVARTVRVFTQEALAEALTELKTARAAQETLTKEIRDAELHAHRADKALLTQRGAVAELRAKRVGHENARAGLLQQRDALSKELERFAAPVAADAALAAQFQARWKTLDDAGSALEQLRAALTEASAKAEERRNHFSGIQKAAALQTAELKKQLEGSAFGDLVALRAARLDAGEATRVEALQSELEARRQALAGQLHHVREQVRVLREEAHAPEAEALSAAAVEDQALQERIATATEQRATHRNDLSRDDQTRQAQSEQLAQWEEERTRLGVWTQLRRLIGSANGAAFRQFAQGLSLDLLVRHANRHLARLSERYRLRRVEGGELTLEILDRHQADATRPMQSLSGGESFLASLALALGLSDLAGRNVRIDSLFIDEGFGSLDPDTLDLAVAALDSLRLSNKTVGVISHVELLKERIPVQIRVEKRTGGVSVLHVP